MVYGPFLPNIADESLNLSKAILDGVWNLYLPQLAGGFVGGFSGGLFGALFNYIATSKTRLKEKRIDRYIEHRSAIVQIEHEIIPARVNLSRNLTSTNDSLENTVTQGSNINIRLILRFHRLFLTNGLSLKMLDLELINLYSEVCVLFDILNSDFEYISKIVNRAIEDRKNGQIDISLVLMFVQMAKYLKGKLEETDRLSLKLLAYCKLTFNVDEDTIMKKYIKDAREITYEINDLNLNNKMEVIIKEETKPYNKSDIPNQFFAPFLDFKRTYDPSKQNN